MKAVAVPSTNAIIGVENIFQSLTTPYIVFAADDPTFTIIEQNKAHAAVSMSERNDVVGKPLFDVFPDTSEEYLKTGHSQLLESIRQVIKTGKSDSLPLLKYDIK